MSAAKKIAMHDIDKALFIRNQGLFKAELRDMRDEDIKMRLATRRWMEMENRKELSWQEVLARTELERRQKRRPDLFQVISLESELWHARLKLKKAQVTTAAVAVLAVIALALLVFLWAGGSEIIGHWLTAAAGQISQKISGLNGLIEGWFAKLRW
jgi:hypothetical protein